MKKIIFAFALASLFTTPMTAVADNCGNSARAQLPACVNVFTAGGKAVVQNNCSHAVDVKFDRRNKTDSRRTVNPRETVANYDVADFYWCCTVGNCDNDAPAASTSTPASSSASASTPSASAPSTGMPATTPSTTGQ